MAFLPAIAAVASIAGGALSGIAAYKQNKAAEASSKYNAQVEENAADAARDAAAAEGQDTRRKLMGQRATSIANRGASGVTFAGTPLMVDEDILGEIELDVMRVGQKGAAAATEHENRAKLDRMSARNYNRAAPLAAGASLLGGIAQARF
jgi:hypothetical protein